MPIAILSSNSMGFVVWLDLSPALTFSVKVGSCLGASCWKDPDDDEIQILGLGGRELYMCLPTSPPDAFGTKKSK